MSYIDLIVYNFRVVDRGCEDPLRVANLQLLTPAFDSQEERVFYLTQVEILAQGAPLVSAVVRAQEAMLASEEEALAAELRRMTACLRELGRRSLATIEPVRGRATHVDPVVWAKSLAPFGVPLQAGVQGPSGTSSPLFGLLDAFVGRTKHESFLGKEIRGLRAMYPPFWRELLQAAEELPALQYLRGRDSATLREPFEELLETYAGAAGFLGRHRRKVYGYLELAFKVGREMTIGAFGGVFADRAWDRVDRELESARAERPRLSRVGESKEPPRAAAKRAIEVSELLGGPRRATQWTLPQASRSATSRSSTA